jgi:hypothetical protein
MRVRISDARLLPDLIGYLRECECVAEKVSATEVEVSVPTSQSDRAWRMEVRVYLTAWRIRHQGTEAEIVE